MPRFTQTFPLTLEVHADSNYGYVLSYGDLCAVAKEFYDHMNCEDIYVQQMMVFDRDTKRLAECYKMVIHLYDLEIGMAQILNCIQRIKKTRDNLKFILRMEGQD